MATQFELDCALMSGRAYQTNRDGSNWFPVPGGWSEFFHVPNDTYPVSMGFEAVSFQSTTNSNEIVISFAGTELLSPGDWSANLNLANGEMSAQLLQAVDYYLKIKADNPNATVTFTGHSLGGGLAALMGVFFDCKAVTFDQAPFAASAKDTLLGSNVATTLREYLISKTGLIGNEAAAREDLLADLTGFLSMRETHGGIPRAGRVSNYVMDGEFLEGVSAALTAGRIGTVTELTHGSYFAPFALHSIALLSAFGLNDGLRQATFKLTDLLAMVYDKQLFAHDTDPGSTDTNFLENLLRHQIGNAPGVASADKMLDRFTADLLKVSATGFAASGDLTDALIAFAMQAYYNSQGSFATDPARQLYTATGGGLEFKWANIDGSLDNIKGYSRYFQAFIATLPQDVQAQINAHLKDMADWYLAGTSLSAQAGNEAAFMLGAANTDNLTGGSQADLLVGLGGNDFLDGRGGDDTLVGGDGYDTYTYRIGDGSDTIIDSDKKGRIQIVSADGSKTYDASVFTKDKNNPNEYLSSDGKVKLTHNSPWTLQVEGGTIELGDLSESELSGFGIHLRDYAEAMGEVAPTNTLTGDQNDNKKDTLSGEAGGDLLDGRSDDDFLSGNGGNDQLLGGDGNDTLYGGADDDLLEGNDGNDTANGEAGQDKLVGGKGSDALMGRDGDDLIEGGDDKDIMRGDRGEDKLYADSEIALAEAIAGQGGTPTNEKGDWLDGGEDDDILIGGTGNDALLGGTGDDVIVDCDAPSAYVLRDMYRAYRCGYSPATSDPRRRGHPRSRPERPVAAAFPAVAIAMEIGTMKPAKCPPFTKVSRGGTPANGTWKLAA